GPCGHRSGIRLKVSFEGAPPASFAARCATPIRPQFWRVNSVSGGRFQQIYPLAPQDPEELGTDEPPDVSKSARDRPVHTRAYGTVIWGKRSTPRRRGQSRCLSSSVA